MVTFIDGKPDKNFYRKFKIQISGKPNDVAMIKEILSRRFQHQEWGWPDLILIDGGKAQLNAARHC
jgi:excinuclease ABC subunit C